MSKKIKGGLSYEELLEMADYFEKQYADNTAYSIAGKIRTRVRCAEELEKEYESIGESYMLVSGKITHTMKVGSRDDIDKLIRGSLPKGKFHEDLVNMIAEDVKQQLDNE